MKRSQMLNMIAKHIREEFAPKHEDGWDLSLCHAVTLLDMAEDMGMRPPLLLDQKYKGPLEGWESENEEI